MDVRIDGGRVGSTRAFENEVGAPFDRETIRMDLSDVGEIEIVASEVEAKGAGGRIIGGASGDDGIVVKEMDVVESEFAPGDMEVGIELLNGLTVGRGMGEMDLSLAMRIGEGACGLHENIGLAGDGIVVSGDGLEGSEIEVVEVGAKTESAVAGEMAMLESGGSVEFGGSVVTPQRGVVKGDGMEGKLNRGGKRIPLCFELTGVGCGGEGDVEIVDLQAAGKLG